MWVGGSELLLSIDKAGDNISGNQRCAKYCQFFSFINNGLNIIKISKLHIPKKKTAKISKDKDLL